ncbi:hypothetical protein SAMN05660964_01730 [Thiothrix caldifontis]|jgi:hypothetical protein|uniref:Uncharacterized protein n=1 Tax=Thiothrix caldifontis TaxID=525918 RepID=A0A1H4BNB9_9GAMM|nr:hypothetical protein [Thiothrix caldifontis]SEA49653.1 hypothetical protein SAMN05660964_01730 [Thiothrix caldifontis]
MKAKAVMALAAIASIGLSACSPSSQAIRSSGNGAMSQGNGVGSTQNTFTMNNPAAQSTSYYSSQNLQRPRQYTGNDMPELSSVELQVIGDQIFKNEGGGDISKLVHWNDGEDFASMGIGHFTWYPAGRNARFGSTFPELLSYMQSRGVQVPAWLPREGSPWRSKGELMQAKNTPQVQELQHFLYQTRLLQVQFIVDRTRRAMPKLVNNTPDQLRPHVINNLNAVANTPGGWYALIDYTNFKGEGLSRSGGYNGQNWGLLQVLEDMRPSRPGEQALHEFADAAMRVLERRVRNSPPANNERRWLAGWSSRVNTYRRLLV